MYCLFIAILSSRMLWEYRIFQRTIYKGLRVSAARAFLKPCKKRPNVDIRTNSHATSIILEGKHAVGVYYRKGGIRGTETKVMARREVLVSAGTVNTPKLLQLSGIGPPKLLSKIGIPLKHQLQGVGANKLGSALLSLEYFCLSSTAFWRSRRNLILVSDLYLIMKEHKHHKIQ